ncbi:hypothetical protein IE81DRAFT_242905 [Ceraceosorus guamensis]|uniref:Uncharacterized protein n=1 Tax=Ceraceosorus guamensis TaxID=1522189 RepID=A0A316W4V0_9BASI|nr:hypothetical protein IE81DRAFT_242905 [Ceraceosorus guamensis]PWN44910.1 hypothetical protein IE81DRAFT_242905 [Ceraceosorus guamensis]
MRASPISFLLSALLLCLAAVSVQAATCDNKCRERGLAAYIKAIVSHKKEDADAIPLKDPFARFEFSVIQWAWSIPDRRFCRRAPPDHAARSEHVGLQIFRDQVHPLQQSDRSRRVCAEHRPAQWRRSHHHHCYHHVCQLRRQEHPAHRHIHPISGSKVNMPPVFAVRHGKSRVVCASN